MGTSLAICFKLPSKEQYPTLKACFQMLQLRFPGKIPHCATEKPSNVTRKASD